MTLWIAWAALNSALAAIAALAGERIAALLGRPRRFAWIVALLASTVGPVVVALQSPSTAPRSVSPMQGGPRVPAAPAVVAQRDPAPSPTRPGAERLAATISNRTATVSDAIVIVHRADSWIARAWLVTSSVLLLVLARSLIGLARHRSRWSDAETEVGRVLVSRDAGPAVVGFIRPRIVIPSWVLSVDRSSRELLLRHELEHIRARDTATLLAAEMALVVFPWNAALWWMARRLRSAIEIDCDARVIHATCDAHAYGLALLAASERHAAPLPLATALSQARLHLEVRINAMTAARHRRPIVASLPFVALAVALVAATAWTPRPTPLSYSRQAIHNGRTSAGITFGIDTASSPRAARSIFDTFTGVLVFAAERGRLDIVATSARETIRVVNGIAVAAPLARPGDYYLFDSTGFILVRPASRTFSVFSLTHSSYNYRDGRDGWPSMFEFSPNHPNVFLTGDAAADAFAQHGSANIYWHVDLDGPVSIARGWLAIGDAPASEVGVARWFGASQALAHSPGLSALMGSSIRVTAVMPLGPRGDTSSAPTNFGNVHYVSSLKAADVDLSRLTLPDGFSETPWPGFERVRDRPALSGDQGARWRTLPPPR